MCLFISLHWVLAVAHGLSCSTPCEILIPQPKTEPASPALTGRFLTTRLSGKALAFLPSHLRVEKTLFP